MKSILLAIPLRVFIPLIPFKTLTPTPENPYPWSRVGFSGVRVRVVMKWPQGYPWQSLVNHRSFSTCGKRESHIQPLSTYKGGILVCLIYVLFIFQPSEQTISAEFIHWVAKSKCPFQIVNDRAFHSLMKTRRPEYPIPSAETSKIRVWERISKMLRVSDQYKLIY